MSAHAVTRILSADAYDAMLAATEKFGGIGGGWRRVGGAPYCVLGYAEHLDGLRGRVTRALLVAGVLNGRRNDEAVRAINGRSWCGLRRLTSPFGGCDARVSFADWCRELHVERGT